MKVLFEAAGYLFCDDRSVKDTGIPLTSSPDVKWAFKRDLFSGEARVVFKFDDDPEDYVVADKIFQEAYRQYVNSLIVEL